MLRHNFEAEDLPREFTDENITTVQTAFQAIGDKDDAGTVLYHYFFELHDGLLEDFGLQDVVDVEHSKQLKKIQRKVIKALSHIVNNLKNWKA
mmetsp:Transcript_12409/g.19411  ORF Transcript_12409/g.19411 Transcript_12409/m.19411 type:complete len:93 (+) Transcript_12409:1050-1328(+)